MSSKTPFSYILSAAQITHKFPTILCVLAGDMLVKGCFVSEHFYAVLARILGLTVAPLQMFVKTGLPLIIFVAKMTREIIWKYTEKLIVS